MSAKGYNRQKARRHRRRTTYPELKPWQTATIERPTSGVNKGLPQIQPDGRMAAAKVTRGVFQLTRIPTPPARSKYDPATEDAKHDAKP